MFTYLLTKAAVGSIAGLLPLGGSRITDTLVSLFSLVTSTMQPAAPPLFQVSRNTVEPVTRVSAVMAPLSFPAKTRFIRVGRPK